MSRIAKPHLNETVVRSLENLLEGLLPTEYLGSEKERGVRYIAELVQHYNNPSVAKKRKENISLVQSSRRK